MNGGSNFHKFADADGRILRVRRVKIPSNESARAICNKMSELIEATKKWKNTENLMKYRYVKANSRTNELFIVTEYFDLNFEGMSRINYSESDIREIVEQILRARLALEENKCPNVCIKPKDVFAHSDGTIRIGRYLKYKQFFENGKPKFHSTENEAIYLIQIMKRLTFECNRSKAYSKEFIDFLKFLKKAANNNSTEIEEFFNHRWMRTNISKILSNGLSLYQRPAQAPDKYSLNLLYQQPAPYFASDKLEKNVVMDSNSLQSSLPQLVTEVERERHKQERAKKFKDELLGNAKPGLAVDRSFWKPANHHLSKSNAPSPQGRMHLIIAQNPIDEKKAIFQIEHDNYMYNLRMQKLCANLLQPSMPPVVVNNIDLTSLSKKLNASGKN